MYAQQAGLRYVYVRTKTSAVRCLYCAQSDGIFYVPRTRQGKPVLVTEDINATDLAAKYELSRLKLTIHKAIEHMQDLISEGDYVTSHQFSLRYDENWPREAKRYINT